jgi:hypothetical protein
MVGPGLRHQSVSVPSEVAKLCAADRQAWAVASHTSAHITQAWRERSTGLSPCSGAHSHGRVVPGGRELVRSADKAGWRPSDLLARDRLKVQEQIAGLLKLSERPDRGRKPPTNDE